MVETHFIGDLHFGHKNILVFDGTKEHRPFATIEEHDAELVRRWNSVVGPRDIVWCLGDFALSSQAIGMAAQLKGDKRLVLGNHDHYPTEKYCKYFTKLYGAATLIGNILLTHVPVHPSQFGRYSVNVHGHLHHNRVKRWMPDKEAALPLEIEDTRYINVSAEQIGLTPVPLSWIYEQAASHLDEGVIAL